MAGWCEIEEGDCGEVIGGWNDATLYRWRGGFASDRVNGRRMEREGRNGMKEKRRRESGRDQGRVRGVSEREIIRTSRCNEKI